MRISKPNEENSSRINWRLVAENRKTILFSLRSTGANLLNDNTTCLGDDNLCDLFRPSCLPGIAHADETSILPFASLLDQPTGMPMQKKAEYR